MPRETRKLRDGDETKASSAEVPDEAFDGEDRLGSIAASVVKQNDASSISLGRRRRDDRADPWAPPILSVEVGKDDVVAVLGELFESTGLGRCDCSRNRRIGRPEQARPDADRSCESVVRQAELKAPLPAGECGDVGVGKRMVPKLETLPLKLPDDVWMSHDLAPYDEERRGHVKPP